MASSVFFFLLVFFVAFAFTEQSAETKAKEKDLLAFENWFKGLLEHRPERDTLKVVPRTVVQAWRDRDAFRGLFATEDITEGETVLDIPWHLMITTEKIGDDYPLLKEIYKEFKLNQHESLTVFLVYMKTCTPDSHFWSPWMKILPTKFSSILYFTEDEIKLLGSSFLGKRALYRQHQSKANYEAMTDHIFHKFPQSQCSSPISYEDWRWAETIVESRALSLINDGTDGAKFSAIVPYFDMFNHEDLPEKKLMWGYNSRKMHIHAEASRNYNPSEQVLISYGTKCNDELLEKYGFILEDNSHECVHIDFNMLLEELEGLKGSNQEELWNRKKNLLMEKADQVTDYSFQILPSAVTEEVIFVAEILSYIDGSTEGEVNLHRVQWLIKTVDTLIKSYPKSTKEDEELVASPSFQRISRRARMAIKLRLHERELLEEALTQYKQVEASILGKTQGSKDEL